MDSEMEDSEMEDRVRKVMALGMYGIWLWKTPSYNGEEVFPPKENDMIDMRGGNGKSKWGDYSIQFYQQGKKDGATHACLGHGQTCSVIPIDEVIQKVNKKLEWSE